MRILKKIWETLQQRPLAWLGYLILALSALALESGDELLTVIGVGDCNRVTLPAKMLYQRFATAGYRKPRPHFVRLITLSAGAEPADVLGDPCHKREFVGAILRRLAAVSPSMVVLDFWYSPGICQNGDDALRAESLNQTIKELAGQLPIVVETHSKTLEELELGQDPDVQQLKQEGLTADDQIMDPHVPFSGDRVSYGLARINCDSRRIPLYWPVYPSKEAVKKGISSRIRVATLSYEAATKADPTLPFVLSKILVNDKHPFTSFIAESQFVRIHGIQVICGRTLGDSEDWRNCPPTASLDLSSLRGKVIVIGEISDRDNHKSVLGTVPGYVLQANYLESLLDDRYFSPVNPLKELTLTMIGIIIIVCLFESASSPWRGFGHSFIFVITVFAMCNLLSIYLGVFLVFWLPLVIVPFAELLFTCRVRSKPGENRGQRIPSPEPAAQPRTL